MHTRTGTDVPRSAAASSDAERTRAAEWRDGAKIYTGDSHALQGDGEVNLTALETAMQDVRVQVILHEQPRPAWEWPFAETPTHWIAIGTHRELAQAFRIALTGAIDFLSGKVVSMRTGSRAWPSASASRRSWTSLRACTR